MDIDLEACDTPSSTAAGEENSVAVTDTDTDKNDYDDSNENSNGKDGESSGNAEDCEVDEEHAKKREAKKK